MNNKNTRVDLELQVMGKLPPQAREFEEAVLGAIMIESDAMDEIVSFIDADMFYVTNHQYIFTAMRTLHTAGSPIDLLTVVEQLKKDGNLEMCGGAYYIAQLTNKVGTSANVEYHARVIAEKYIKRAVIQGSSETIVKAYDEDVDFVDVLDNMRSTYDIINSRFDRGKNRDMAIVMQESALKVLKSAERSGKSEHPMHLGDFDVNVNIQSTDFVIIAGRPGMSKTAFALDAARKQAKGGDPVGFISGEMSDVSLGQRLISMEGNIDLRHFSKYGRNDIETQKRIMLISEEVGKYPLYLSENTSLEWGSILSQAKKWVQKKGITRLYIDYIQLCKIAGMKNSANREQEVSAISRGCKQLTMSLKIPVIAMAQLNRPVKGSAVHKPQLTDLRESGSLEQDADIVVFLHRPEYYGIENDPFYGKTKDLCELIVAKYRDGATIDLAARFQKEHVKFYDWDYDTGGEYVEQKRLTPKDEAIETNIPF
jgi:replicative DNA helicase